jgi:hypothetical protein
MIKHAVTSILPGGGGGGDQSTSTMGLTPRVLKALAFARAHGWTGSVTSGFRSDAEQVRIWNAGIRPAAKPRALGGPGSNHSLGQAVDVSDIPGFARAMAMMPPNQRLYSRVPGDPVHFSVSGNRVGGLIGFAAGGRLDRQGLMDLWMRAGGSRDAAAIAAAVALAESRGVDTVSPPNSNGTVDRGYWQINSVHGAMSSLDPMTNAKAAISISSNGRNWNPWTEYRNGDYKKYLGTGPNTGSTGSVSGGTAGVGSSKPAGPPARFGPGGGRLTGYVVPGRNKHGATNTASGVGTTSPGGFRGSVPKGGVGTFARPKTANDVANNNALLMGRAGVDLAFATKEKDADPTKYVPKAIREALNVQERVARSNYVQAQKQITTLEKKRKTKGLTRKEQGSLSGAYQAASDALGQLNSARDAIKNMNDQYAPPDPQVRRELAINARLAQQQVGGDIAGQLQSMRDMVAAKTDAYNAAIKSGDPQKIIDAAGALQQARDDLKSVLDQVTFTDEDYANAALSQAQLTDSINDDIQAMTSLDAIYKARYDAAVASGDPRKIAEAANQYGQVHSQLVALTPTAMDYANQTLAQAQLTDSFQDDIAALTTIDQLQYDAYTKALATGDPKKIAQAASDYKSAHDALIGATPTAMDYANAQMAQAQLTDTLDDDITAVTSIFNLQKKAYDDAVASGDPRRIAQAASDYKSARDSLESLQNSSLPTAISLGGRIDPGVLAAIGAASGQNTGMGSVVVNQNFVNPPNDPLTYLTAAQFAAQGVFSG